MWKSHLIVLWLLSMAAVESRHLTASDDPPPSSPTHLRVKNGGKKRSTAELGPAELDVNYEPVVLKLEVHFRKKRKKVTKAKNLEKLMASYGLSSAANQSANGFIHLFLPLSAGGGGSLPTADPIKKTSHKKKKSRKKMRPDAHDEVIRWKKAKKISAPPSDADRSSPTENRLLPLMQDDGIPPLLNSLSANETRLWAQWLRCTLCLKNGRQADQQSALCDRADPGGSPHQSGRRNRRSSDCQANVSVDNDLTASGCQERDVCSDWQDCENEHLIPAMFASLPPCPCTYPTGLVYNDRVWDPLHRHHFRWREISLESERVDIYRPGAVYCIRSLSVIPRLALAAQQCCYDDRRRLLTRGWAAGTPALVSPEASVHLSRVTERLPWLACKGDFSRYHLQRPPDNRLNCSLNPSDQEFQRQVLLATNY